MFYKRSSIINSFYTGQQLFSYINDMKHVYDIYALLQWRPLHFMINNKGVVPLQKRNYDEFGSRSRIDQK
jgi:hypothetical protein